MQTKPSLSPFQKLLNLILTDPVVLLVVKNRDQHVKMRKKLLQSRRRPNL